MTGPSYPRRRPPPFRPVFGIVMLYFFGFFLLFSLLLIGPELMSVAGTADPGPELQDRAQEVAQEAVRGRLPLAFLAALVTTGLGIYTRRLPGLRNVR